MEIKLGEFIYLLVQAIVFMTPVVILFYRYGKREQEFVELKKDLEGIGKKLAELGISHREAVSALSRTQEDALDALNRRVETLDKVIVEVATTMKFVSSMMNQSSMSSNRGGLLK